MMLLGSRPPEGRAEVARLMREGKREFVVHQTLICRAIIAGMAAPLLVDQLG